MKIGILGSGLGGKLGILFARAGHDVVFGFEPMDAGPLPLRIARYLEPFALLMGRLAYDGDRGPKVAYRFEQYA
jgi:predicted dinucleotide-binding enzyme